MRESSSGRVVVFGLGGTIAMTSNADGGVTPTLSASDLVAAVPGLSATGIPVEVVDFRQLPGASVGFADLAELATAIDTTVSRGAAGVVITQGTDTIEETAYHLDLTYTGPQPVVVTGAMRNPMLAGADGPANLLAAVITAAHPAARDHGVVVVFNDEIHAARRVRKTHSTATSTFQSPNGGPLGFVIEGTPRLVNSLPGRLHVPPALIKASPRVGLHTVVLDDDGTLLEGTETKLDGLVIAAMGVGHVPQSLVEPLTKIAAEIPVVLSSRTGAGSTLTRTYGFPGSERDLIERSIIPAGLLDPLKARLLLRAFLAAGVTRAEMIQGFKVAGGQLDHHHWPWPAT